ncbi:hypothetical protein Taro_046937 [Colocasia esculenta]|uniref:PHD and RING finger domain-containing protein 1 n=1 Tax=Colocasia esculenta TaxID=4460 RepID=A0A843X4T2_COLES|nr:hypothetical protein [Colocasia esculenta]
MANNTVIGGKIPGKRGGRGGGGWRRGRGARVRRGSGSEDASDKDYVVGGDGEEEYESSEDSYSTDASLEASEENACSEEEEGDEEDEGEYDPRIKGARGRRQRKEAADAGRGRRRAASPFVVGDVEDEKEEEMEAPPMRKARALRRLRHAIPAEDEGDECDDADDDEDFAPEEDEDDEEEMGGAPLRRFGGRRNSPVKLQRREARSRNFDLREKGWKAPARVTNNRRRRVVETSSDDDFIVRDGGTSVEASDAKEKKRKGVSHGRKRRRAPASRSDPSESDSSDFDYAISMEESRDLRVGRPLGNLVERRPPSSSLQGDKGKGKDDGDLGKQVCGICLSEEKKGIVRGLLDCCAHYFCFVCIMEWSKVESRCPLCKRRFKTLRKLTSSDLGFGLRRSVVSIPERNQVYQPSEEEIRGYLDPYANVVCIECHQGVDDNLLLLCDICDSPAHTYCVGLGSEVPEGNWYCNGCRCVERGSSHSQLQESVFEHRARSDRAQVNLQNGIHLGNASLCVPHERPHRLMTFPCQHPSDEIGEGASSIYLSSVGDHETALRVPGFTASTVSGRRSLHQRIRTMISINWMRWIPEGVARDSVIRPTIIENNLSGYGIQQHGETLHVQQEGFTNGIDERSSRSVMGSRVNVHPCTPNEGTSCQIVEAAREFHQ